MPVPLDGLCFGLLLWLITSCWAVAVLRQRMRGAALFWSIVGCVVGLGVMSFGAFIIYEFLAGRA